jgi:pyruvate formate lyase activating enzyme
LAARRARLIVRVPLIPGVNDDADNIRGIGLLVSSLSRVEAIDVLPYHETGLTKYDRLGKAYTLHAVARPTAGRTAEVAGILQTYVASVRIGGLRRD